MLHTCTLVENKGKNTFLNYNNSHFDVIPEQFGGV